MRNILGALTVTTMLAAGAAFAADVQPTQPTQPGSTAPAASSTTSSTTTTTTEKTDVMKLSHAGVVKSFDAKTHMLTLKDGSSFVLDESMKGDDLKANDKIALNYKTDGTKKIVVDYKIGSNS
jgi:hypothetical protein